MTYECDGPLQLYIRDISKTPLLTREEEKTLAERIQNGDEKAREHMITANLRLVVKIAQDYADYGMPITDLISEGNIGLMRAVEKFNPNVGAKFSTYAIWWIRQGITRALTNQSKTIRLPANTADKIARIRRIASILTEELKRLPTDEELSDELGISCRTLTQLLESAHQPISLNIPLNEGEETELGAIIPDETSENPLEIVSRTNMLENLADFLSVLNARERWVIESRFGLNGQKEWTLEELSKEVGITREGIRLTQNRALLKIKQAIERAEKPGTGKNTPGRGMEPISISTREQSVEWINALRSDTQGLERVQDLMKQSKTMSIQNFYNFLHEIPVAGAKRSWMECISGIIIHKKEKSVKPRRYPTTWDELRTLWKEIQNPPRSPQPISVPIED